MWSIYDTCILLSGVITAVIAVLPLSGIPMRTRTGAGLVGGGLIVISLVLGNLRSFRYPSIVLIGPVIALCVLGAVIWDSRRGEGKDVGRQFDETTSGSDPDGSGVHVATGHPLEHATGVSEASADGAAGNSSRTAAWSEVHDPATPSERLTQLAAEYPEFAPAIVAHRNCYPGLVEWARENGLLD